MGVIPVAIRIWPVENDAWNGMTYFKRAELDALSADARSVIGIAGAAAVMRELKIPFAHEMVSPEDWQFIGDRSDVTELIDAATSLLTAESETLLTVARAIIVKSRG